MNKKILIIIAVIVILLLLGGGFFFLKKSSAPKSESVNTKTPEPTKSVVGMMKDTLTNLMTSGKSLQCTFTYQPQGMTSSSQGTVYLSGGKVRGDFEVTVPKLPTIHSSMIRDTDYTYIWGSSLPSGIKIKNSSAENFQGASADAQKKYVDFNQQLDYKCNPWTADASKFSIPTNIQFQDMSSVMSPSGEMPGKAIVSPASQNTAACNACNSLTGQAKTMCIQQFKCQ